MAVSAVWRLAPIVKSVLSWATEPLPQTGGTPDLHAGTQKWILRKAWVSVAVTVVILTGGFGAEVLELVVADGDNLFIGQDTFEDFHEVARADAGDDVTFFEFAVLIFHKDEEFSERAEDGAAGNSNGGLGFAEGDTEESSVIWAQAVIGIGDGRVEVKTGFLGGVACIEALEDAVEFLALEDIERERGGCANLDFVEFGRLEDEALREEFGVIAHFDK